MEIDALHSKFAGVNGTKTKSLRYRLVKRLTSQKRAEQGIFLTRLSKSIIGILSDDFATVDVREELCYHSRPKKHKFRGLKEVFIQSGLSCRRNRGQKIIRTLTWCLGSYYSGMVRSTGIEPAWG